MRSPVVMKKIVHPAVLCAALLLGGCASTGRLVSAPGVSLSDVSLTNLSMSRQTFQLGFDVTNPNPFPLPVRSVSYGIELDGQRFASGETTGAFTVPAMSDGEFVISVDLNLLETAPQLLFVVRDGVRREIPYSLTGEFGIDIPLVQPVAFESSGKIQLESSRF